MKIPPGTTRSPLDTDGLWPLDNTLLWTSWSEPVWKLFLNLSEAVWTLHLWLVPSWITSGSTCWFSCCHALLSNTTFIAVSAQPRCDSLPVGLNLVLYDGEWGREQVRTWFLFKEKNFEQIMDWKELWVSPFPRQNPYFHLFCLTDTNTVIWWTLFIRISDFRQTEKTKQWRR